MLNDTMSMITVINQCKWFTLIFYQSSFYLHCDFFHQLGLHLHCNENKESHIDCRCYYIRLMYGCPYANGCLLAYGCPYASHCLFKMGLDSPDVLSSYLVQTFLLFLTSFSNQCSLITHSFFRIY